MIHLTCDVCGLPIAGEHLSVELRVSGRVPGPTTIARPEIGGIGHYHSEPDDDGLSCYQRMRDALDLVREHGRTLAALPAMERGAGAPPPIPPIAEDSTSGLPDPTCTRERREPLDYNPVLKRRLAVARRPDGIGRLGLSRGVSAPLLEADVLTIDDVRRRLADGSIAEVKGLGPRRRAELQRALERCEQSS